MASKIIIFIAALFAVQCAEGASLKQRSIVDLPIIGPLINSTISKAESAANVFLGPLLQNLQDGLSQAEGFIANASAHATQVISAATAPLQGLIDLVSDKVNEAVANAVEFGKNRTLCVLGQEERAKNITKQAAFDIATCTQAAIQPSVALFGDIGSLKAQAFGLVNSIPGNAINCALKGIPNIAPCIFNDTQSLSQQALLIASALTQDIVQMGQQAFHLPETLVACGAQQLAKATEQVGVVISDIGTCIKNYAQSS